jgi:Tripartite tricarboxylate transporter family receptor
MNQAFGVKTTYVPFKGTGDMTMAVLGGHVDGSMTYTAFAINNKTKVRALAVAMEARHPLMPDVPTFKELGVDWVDGAYRGIGVPKATPPEARKRLSDLWALLNAEHQGLHRRGQTDGPGQIARARSKQPPRAGRSRPSSGIFGHLPPVHAASRGFLNPS